MPAQPRTLSPQYNPPSARCTLARPISPPPLPQRVVGAASSDWSLGPAVRASCGCLSVRAAGAAGGSLPALLPLPPPLSAAAMASGRCRQPLRPQRAAAAPLPAAERGRGGAREGGRSERHVAHVGKAAAMLRGTRPLFPSRPPPPTAALGEGEGSHAPAGGPRGHAPLGRGHAPSRESPAARAARATPLQARGRGLAGAPPTRVAMGGPWGRDPLGYCARMMRGVHPSFWGLGLPFRLCHRPPE